jgi:hypothetical protein
LLPRGCPNPAVVGLISSQKPIALYPEIILIKNGLILGTGFPKKENQANIENTG